MGRFERGRGNTFAEHLESCKGVSNFVEHCSNTNTMGQLWSRDKSLESPLVNAIPEDAGQAERKLPFDPRSVSDDVSRTPIQIKEDDDDDEPTPGSGAKLLLSDSGVDEVRATCDTPTSAEILLQK